MTWSVQLLAERAKEQPKPEAAPVSAPLAAGPAPARAAAAVQSHAEGSQQSPAALIPAAQLDPSTAWKLEKMEAQVGILCMLGCCPLPGGVDWDGVLSLASLSPLTAETQAQPPAQQNTEK